MPTPQGGVGAAAGRQARPRRQPRGHLGHVQPAGRDRAGERTCAAGHVLTRGQVLEHQRAVDQVEIRLAFKCPF
jgi:peptide methionine sulfoxide reductase MsrB